MDGNVLSSLLTELLNHDGKTSVELPVHRIKELLAMGSRKINIASEVKTNETQAAIYCLCFYYSFATQYQLQYLFEFVSFAQALICESQIVIQRGGPHRLEMCDFSSTFQRNESIEIEYLYEIFNENLLIAQSIGRVMVTKLRTILKNVGQSKSSSKKHSITGGDGISSSNSSSKQQRGSISNDTGIDCYSPQCLYFLCSFALSNIAANLKVKSCLNYIPGMVESVVVMLLTRSADHNTEPQQPQVRVSVHLGCY